MRDRNTEAYLQASSLLVKNTNKGMNFTVELWVNPTTTHQVDAQATTGTAGMSGQKYAIHPAYGGTSASGEAGMGISVGTNGVSVYAHAGGYMPALLSWSGTLDGWTHIGVVCINKQPRLYINGVLVKTGLTSTKTLVHPSYGFMGGQYGTMDGAVDEIRIWNVARTATEIQTNYNKIIKPTTPNLAGYWAMNESHGHTILDLTNHGLDQPLISSVERSAPDAGAPVTADAPVPPTEKSALTLSGTAYNDQQMLYTVSNTFTVELWVKPTTTHQIDAQATTGTAGTSGQRYAIAPATAGSVTTEAGMGISVGTNGVSVYEWTNSYMPALLVWSGTVSGWTHIAVVYNNKQPSLYINGQFVKTGLTSPKSLVHPSYSFMGGNYGTMPGKIDELRIWNVARTAEEIAANYDKAIEGNPPSLVGYWPMNEGSGTVVYDITGNGLNRTLVNNATWSTESSEVASPVNDDPAFASGYRYGFNGKEKDDDDFGDTHYDYGFRIYNPRIARFLSVDPLTKSYPMLTPYQFASNRPIDGIDQDGLEYYTIHVAIHDKVGRAQLKIIDHTNMRDADIRQTHGISPKRFFKRYSKSFGPLGRGVLYVYHNYEDGVFKGSESEMQLESNITRHGIYYGTESITYTGLQKGYEPPNETAAYNYYDFSKSPIDEVDALAKQHDMEYAEFAQGYEGWFADERTAQADLNFILGLRQYLENIQDKKYKDKYTGKRPSREARFAAENANALFSGVYVKKYGENSLNDLNKKLKNWNSERREKINNAKNEWSKLKEVVKKLSR